MAEPINPPSKVGEWSIKQITECLSRKLPPESLKTKKIGGQTITYLPWHEANRILDKYCPGWDFRINNSEIVGDEYVVTGALYIRTVEGVVCRESTGSEKIGLSGYGETAANAEAQCFRRCCARFGLGLYLYQK